MRNAKQTRITKWFFFANSRNRSNKSVVQWLSRLTSKRNVVGPNPIVGKNFSFCNCNLLSVLRSWTEPIHMKLTVTYTSVIITLYGIYFFVHLCFKVHADLGIFQLYKRKGKISDLNIWHAPRQSKVTQIYAIIKVNNTMNCGSAGWSVGFRTVTNSNG